MLMFLVFFVRSMTKLHHVSTGLVELQILVNICSSITLRRRPTIKTDKPIPHIRLRLGLRRPRPLQQARWLRRHSPRGSRPPPHHRQRRLRPDKTRRSNRRYLHRPLHARRHPRRRQRTHPQRQHRLQNRRQPLRIQPQPPHQRRPCKPKPRPRRPAQTRQ